MNRTINAELKQWTGNTTMDRNALIELSNLAYGLATMARGAQKRRFNKIGRDALRQAMDMDGPLPSDIDAMDDDELLAALAA